MTEKTPRTKQTETRRGDLLRRKYVVMSVIEKSVTATPMPGDQHKVAVALLDGIELLLDVLIDIAHPVK